MDFEAGCWVVDGIQKTTGTTRIFKQITILEDNTEMDLDAGRKGMD
jgi:hypothetical protein